MNRSKLTKLILCMLLMVTVFSVFPVVNASTPEDWGPKPWPWQKGGWPAYIYKKDAGNWIGGWPFLGVGGEWWIPHDEASWFRMGWQVSDFEIEAGWDPGPPYKFRLFVDGEEIHMQAWARHFKAATVMFPDGVERTVTSRAWFCYASFDPDFFEVGDHEIRFQFLVKKPYIGSDSNEWRYYANYQDGEGFIYWYGDVGLEWNQIHILHVY